MRQYCILNTIMTMLEKIEKDARDLSPAEILELVKRLLNQLPTSDSQPTTPRPYALAKGLFEVPASFDDPLPDDLLDAFLA